MKLQLPTLIFQNAKLFAVLAVAIIAFEQFAWCQAVAPIDKPNQKTTAALADKHRNILRKYCFDCHDSETQEGKVDLQALSLDLGTLKSAELWQKVLGALNAGEMPPKDEPQLSAAEKTLLLRDLSETLVVARRLLSDTGGVITMRRLNRREYENTMRELLGVSVDASQLPEDGGAGTFDTVGASLFFSSDQFEQYMKIAKQALDTAIVTRSKPKPYRQRVQVEAVMNKRVKAQMKRLSDSHARALAWQADKTQPPTEFGFIDAARVEFEEGVYKRQFPTLHRYSQDPLTESGALMYLWFQGSHIATTSLPAKAAPGNYVFRFRVAALDHAEPSQRFVEFGLNTVSHQGGEMNVLACRAVTGTMDNPQVIEFPVEITASADRTYGVRQKLPNSRDYAKSTYLASVNKTKVGPMPDLWLDWIEVESPTMEVWPPASHTRIFDVGNAGAAKKDVAHAKQVIRQFAQRAFRIKPPSEGFMQKLVGLYQLRRKEGDSFEEAIKEPLAVILSSPSFLYLREPTERPADAGKPGPKRTPLTQPELAVRLAYFLWSSPPDEQLMDVANQGQLLGKGKLWQQTNRMLRDPKAKEFIAGFTHQWLHMERLEFFQFNFRLYPDFDESVKEAARQEVFATIENAILEGKPIQQLLDSDYVMVNDVLADYYGIDGVEGQHFRPVKVPADSHRGGLLAMAAIMAMGSDGERTSPVERGAWVLRKILNDPPPPAPANVPQLSRLLGKPLSARQMQVAHMEEPQCAQCHEKIDPIGFGLENFDAVGRWRTEEFIKVKNAKGKLKQSKALPIEPAGTLPSGESFEDFPQLRQRIATHHQDFARGFTQALIEYGLGRPYGFSDQDLADQIMAHAAEKDYRLHTFIHALVHSKQFKTK